MRSKPAKEWRKALNQQRQSGRPVKADLWDNLYNELDRALRNAKNLAERELSNYQEVRRRQFETKAGNIQQRRGESPTFPLTNK
jgi:dsDNA-specific endonuclease/ATPase MutS2